MLIVVLVTNLRSPVRNKPEKLTNAVAAGSDWQPPDTLAIPHAENGELILYGRELIMNTAKYLGSKGSVAKISNGMNCQNCHLHAGAQLFSNPFSAVASTYPKYRDRSGRVESIEFRINECMERSLNGKKMDSLSKEMVAMVAYLKWIGSNVPQNNKPRGTGVEEIAFLDRAADPGKGEFVYNMKCRICHGVNGEGKLLDDSSGYVYPPLWGNRSYNVSAGMYRISRLAGFIKNSMPFGTTWQKPALTDEESWDVAAFISSQMRPDKRFGYDWKNISTKPVDHPFGPFSDSFSEKQHKYGPFGPIKKKKDKT
jgi:thiosulfate dehydrogenase